MYIYRNKLGMKKFFYICLLPLFFLFNPLYSLTYTASIEGIEDKKLLSDMLQASATIAAIDKSVPNPITLKLRANGDVDRLKNVAQNAGFFNCTVEPFVAFSDSEKASVIFHINLGPIFSLGKLSISWSDEDIVRSSFSSHQEWIEKRLPSPSLVRSFKEGEPATGKRLLAMPEELSSALRSKGYAFCKIINTELLANRSLQRVDVSITVQTGPITRFGKPIIHGVHNVNETLFKSHLAWKEGDFYSPRLIDKTENSLQHTGLFQSVQLDEGDSISDDWMIPMNIRVVEAKARTINAGISYTTTYGPGCSIGWEHRNIGGLGRKLSAQAQLWQKMRTASLSYTIPNFYRDDQNLIWILEHDEQTYLPFESATTQGSLLLDKQLSRRMDCVIGITIERLSSRRIIQQELFYLLKTPCQLRWSSANSPLDPTKGVSFTVRATPSFQVLVPTFSYFTQLSTLAGYYSICHDTITFAARAQAGNIFGASRHAIPLPDRLFGGSENSLRGYRTGSVSPLNKHGQPIGGRSLITGTLEARFRSSTNLGWVAFYDTGEVFSHMIPPLQEARFLHSVGVGVRYQTPIGPLRLDIGVPLQRRKHIDSPFQIYFSIGQAF